MCIRCKGLVVNDAGETRCLNCGWRPPIALIDLQPLRCYYCTKRPPDSGYKTCAICREKHAKQHKAALAYARERKRLKWEALWRKV